MRFATKYKRSIDAKIATSALILVLDPDFPASPFPPEAASAKLGMNVLIAMRTAIEGLGITKAARGCFGHLTYHSWCTSEG